MISMEKETSKNVRQGILSDKIDLATVQSQLQNLDVLSKAHFNLQLGPRSGTWLNLLPCDSLGNHIPGPLFNIMLKRRLRIDIFSRSDHCLLCDQLMDVYGDHAISCGSGGDRNYRHNALRNRIFYFCSKAKLNPKLEVKGLLRNHSRPADILIPNFRNGQQCALDIGITSGLIADVLHISAEDNMYATESYSQFKRKHLDTDQKCKESDIKFIPMIMEGSAGVWSSESEEILKLIIRTTTSITREPISLVSNDIFQNLSMILQKANSRAILERIKNDSISDPVHEGASNILVEVGIDGGVS